MNQNWSIGELRHAAKRDGPRIIAECGLCHDGSLARAEAMIEAAAAAGCHGVKFQKRSARHWFEDRRPRRDDRASFGDTEGAHRRALEFSPAEHLHLRSCAQRRGLGYGISVWDLESLVEALTVIRPDWIKLGRPMLVKHRETAARMVALAMRWWALEREVTPVPPIHYSARSLAEAAGIGMPGDGVPYFCPGGYPDYPVPLWRELDLVTADPIRGGGVSVHWIHEGATATLARRLEAIVIEQHMALPGTRHGDAAWSLSPEQFRALVLATRVRAAAERKEAVA